MPDSEPDVEDARTALEAVESNQQRRATFFLRRALPGEETRDDRVAVGGHVFEEREDGFRECVGSGCELIEGFDTEHQDVPVDYGWENVKRVAEAKDCPLPAEGIHLDDQNVSRCPECHRKTPNTLDECQKCGAEVEEYNDAF